MTRATHRSISILIVSWPGPPTGSLLVSSPGPPQFFTRYLAALAVGSKFQKSVLDQADLTYPDSANNKLLCDLCTQVLKLCTNSVRLVEGGGRHFGIVDSVCTRFGRTLEYCVRNAYMFSLDNRGVCTNNVRHLNDVSQSEYGRCSTH